MLNQDSKLQESVTILRGIGQQFDCVHDKLDATHGVVLDIHDKLNQFLERHHITSTINDPLHISVTNERERELILGYRQQLRELPEESVSADDWLMLGDGLAATGSFAEAQESHAMAAVEAHSQADIEKEAEAHFKAYRTRCELRQWADALSSLNAAIALQPRQYRLFDTRYEPIAILGAGGFGTVFHCKDRYVGTDVAIKTLHAADLDRTLNEIFAEAHTLRQLEHPGIIRVIDQNFADTFHQERPYFVLEYFPGETLEALVKRDGPLPLEDVLTIAVEIADAVNAAHEQGILHRDLKPGNVMVHKVKEKWNVKVIDFGLAVRTKVATNASLQLSASIGTVRDASFTGTLDYASPEQKGKLPGVKVGPRSDIYSLGKTCLYTLFDTLEVKSKHWAKLPELHRDAVQALFEKATDEDVQDRHRGIGELRDAVASLRIDPEAERRLRSENLDRYKAAHEARSWVEARLDGWDDSEWRGLLHKIKEKASYWLINEAGLGLHLERLRSELRSIHDAAFASSMNETVDRDTAKSVIVQPRVAKPIESQRVAPIPQSKPALYEDQQHHEQHKTRHFSWPLYVGIIPLLIFFVSGYACTDWTIVMTPRVQKEVETKQSNDANAPTFLEEPYIGSLEGHTGDVLSVTYSPDGKQIASGSDDKSIRIWDTASGQTVQTLKGHTALVRSVVYSPDGKQIASGSYDNTIRIWDVSDVAAKE